MSDRDLIDAVAHVTGEDSHEIRRRGFTLTGPATAPARFDHIAVTVCDPKNARSCGMNFRDCVLLGSQHEMAQPSCSAIQ